MASLPKTVQLGRGEVASLVRSHDWRQSSLGHPDTWPQALHTVLSLILNSKFPMFVAWGPEFSFLYNDAYTEMLAHKHPQALGRPFQEVWPEIWNDVSPIVEQAMQGQSSYYENLPLKMQRRGYDEQTWFTFSYSPVYDDSGKVAGVYCACTETTQQVLAERHRIDENERLRRLFQQAPGIIAVLRSPAHVFELANDAYYRLIGHRELIGFTVRQALPELAGQGLYELLDRVFTTGEPFVGRAVPVRLQRQKSGDLEQRYVDFIYQPIRDVTGSVTGIFIEGSDVTEAVKANQALRDSEQRLLQLANTIPHLAWMANADGSIHWYNERWYKYTGDEFQQMQGWGWQSLHDPKQLAQVMERMKRCLASGEPFEAKSPLRSASGEYRMFFTRATPLRDAAGNIVQWFGTNTDIHEMEQAQEELKQANRRKDEFLAMLAHELRNPLAPISSAAELLKMRNLDERAMRKTSDIIARQVTHMTELVDDLLDVSRVTRGLVSLHKEPLDLRQVIADAVEQIHSMAEAKQQQLQVDTGAAAALVEGDHTRLTQIFSNILNNAVKYSPTGGCIRLRLMQEQEQIQVAVKDNGIGVDAQLLPHLFDLFTQAERSPDRSQGGLGLGLALVKSLVGLHSGQVAAQSAGIGKGTEITVTLPRLHRAEQVAEVHRHTPEPDASSLSILVVDDNVDAAQTLAMLLELQGHAVSVAHDARSALRCIAAQVPQVMILDIGLPDMDGYELAQRIHAMPEAASAALIALSGYGQTDDVAKSAKVGFAHHLVKPVSARELTSALAEVAAAYGGGP